MNSLNRLAELWPLDKRRSRIPHSTLWHEIFRLSGDGAATILFRQAPASPGYKKSFIHALTLADDFVQGFENVDDDFVGSVLLYYGAYWLGHAVALATLDSEALGAREGSHGLDVQFDFSNEFPILEAKIDPGKPLEGFGTINRALGGESLNGREMRTCDFVSAIPELRHSLPHLHLKSRAIQVISFVDGGDEASETIERMSRTISLVLHVEQTITKEWIRDHIAVASYLSDQGVSPDAAARQISWTRAPSKHGFRSVEDELRAVTIEHDGARFFLPKIKQRIVSEYGAYLAVLFVICSAARYQPDYWIQMQESRSPEFFFLHEFLDLAEDKMPVLALNHLTRCTHDFIAK